MTVQDFNIHVSRLRPILRQVGFAFFRNGEEAEDVAQEALMRLWLLRDSLPEDGSLQALAVRIAKNVCVSEWRRQKLRTTIPLEAVGASADSAQADTPLEEQEGEHLLAEAIEQLTPSQRRLFQLKQSPEMDINQMALLTGMKPRSVSAKLSEARRRLHEYIKRKM